MSSNGIYTALSGAVAQSQRMDTIANNIANSNTTAFKKDQQTFYEYVTANEKPPDVIQVPRVPASIESFYDMQGGDRGYVDSSGTYTDHSQGQLKKTGNKLDVALEGKGLFEVLTPQGVQYTRNGSFKIDNQGRLVTKHGFPVLMAGAAPPETRTLNLENQNVIVSYTGEIYQGNENLGKISVVEVQNADALKKQGASYFAVKENFAVQTQNAEAARLHQGFVEGSNVNIVQEMTDMISASRAFESAQKAIRAFDMIDQKLMNDVPKAGY
ncbi:MAG: flagellar basal-body rod protein FlgF [Bdellovibrionaceae bacterium]|nr:flagellar basal-body rod protein FlgF [Pseudobdellovibrionaceae bacterium]|tara:strand:+ start:44292 stop:45101 length:810 start_codon:yes stop_codon:yes gene_type:complete